jgi:hypothetical protein
LSRIDLEITDELDFEVGDCVIVIKEDGRIGKIVMPEMNVRSTKTAGYTKLLEVIDMIKPGARKQFYKHNKRKLH